VFLEKHELFFEFLKLHIVQSTPTTHWIATHSLLFLEVCVPMEDRRRWKLRQIVFKPICKFVFKTISPFTSAKGTEMWMLHWIGHIRKSIVG
jgi:hypothetical protein